MACIEWYHIQISAHNVLLGLLPPMISRLYAEVLWILAVSEVYIAGSFIQSHLSS